jgi:hypothetical protein
MFDLSEKCCTASTAYLYMLDMPVFASKRTQCSKVASGFVGGKVRPDFLSHDGGADDGMSVARC